MIVSGRDLGRSIPLDKAQLVVGRAREADVRIDDDVISRRQCRFVVREGHVYVEDLHSSCGTYVDGEKVASSPLRDGQRVLVGNTVFLVRQTAATVIADPQSP